MSGSAVDACFNDMLKRFIVDLTTVFPDNQQLAFSAAGFDLLVAADPTGPMKSFMEAIDPHADLVAAKDPALFGKFKFPGIDFKTLWESDIAEEDRETIWTYVRNLHFMATLLRSLTPELTNTVNTMVQQIQNGGALDLPSVMGMLASSGGFPMPGVSAPPQPSKHSRGKAHRRR